MTSDKIYVVLSIPFLTDDAAEKIRAAEQLLREAGIKFDTGSDGKSRDWFIDWSSNIVATMGATKQ